MNRQKLEGEGAGANQVRNKKGARMKKGKTHSTACSERNQNPTPDRLKELIGKAPRTVITFTGEGTFDAFHAACDWLKERGYSIASTASGLPTGVKRGDYSIAKWYALEEDDRHLLDGVIADGDYRHGPVTVILATEEREGMPPEAALQRARELRAAAANDMKHADALERFGKEKFSQGA